MNTRFDFIMAQVDSWAEENAGWDCRAEVEQDVIDMMNDEANYSDAYIVEQAILSWEMHE